MTSPIALDASPLGKVSHPRPNLEIMGWLKSHLQAGTDVFVPEIAYYEVRRELLRAEKRHGLARLEELRATLIYLPLDTPMIERAAEFWALSRRKGTPTGDPKELDCDAILAAQAESVGAVVATENLGPLSQFVPAKSWRELPAS